MPVRLALDAGCGKGDSRSPFGMFASYFVGLDVFYPYLKSCKANELFDDVVMGDVKHLPFRNESFDVAMSFNVIEHLEKEDGDLMLRQLERVAKKYVMVTTSYEFYEQHSYDGNPYQEHLSHWSEAEFKERGYEVIPFLLRYPRPRRGSSVREMMRVFLSLLFHPLVRHFPDSFAMGMLAMKGTT